MDENVDANEMHEMYGEEDWVSALKIYGGAFAFVVLVILPWTVGAFQLGRWIFF